MSDGWNIALLGATGAVGTALLEIMQERQFPFGELFLLSSARNAGETVWVNGQSLQVSEAAQFDWSQAQLVFFVAGVQTSALYAAEAAAVCLVVDVSGLFALEPDGPLVVPGVNDDVLADYRDRNMVAVADALTSQILLAVKPLTDLAGLAHLHVRNLLSASSHGKAAVDNLAGQRARLLNGLPDDAGSVRSERHLVGEVRKILRDEGLPISVISVQTPIFYGHAQLVHLETLRPMAAEEAHVALVAGEGLMLSEEPDYPTPVEDASVNIALNIGCLRNDDGLPALLQFWLVAANVRFSGALMAVLTAEKLMAEASAW
ncbi:aspartate-semialdehyde dehydrogenase [Sodalis-like symbiont of Philaenus spumarius]|nr:aspartate-semialdehyde dehydrogenase [Sodalis-like symbiont of Philaenus spumarius]